MNVNDKVRILLNDGEFSSALLNDGDPVRYISVLAGEIGTLTAIFDETHQVTLRDGNVLNLKREDIEQVIS